MEITLYICSNSRYVYYVGSIFRQTSITNCKRGRLEFDIRYDKLLKLDKYGVYIPCRQVYMNKLES